MVAGYQIFFGVNVGAVVAGADKRRRGDAHMYLGRARFAQQTDNPRACRASDYRVVYQHYALAAYGALDGVELDAYKVAAVRLPGGDKGSADVLVLDKTDIVRDARLL